MGLLSSLRDRSPIQSRRRALVKTLGYRSLMIVITIVVAFVFTGDTAASVNIGIVANVVKTGTYYAYERAWDRTTWGISKNAET